MNKIVSVIQEFFSLRRPSDIVKRTILRVVIWQTLFSIPLLFTPEVMRPGALGLAIKLVALLTIMYIAADAVKLGKMQYATPVRNE